MRYLLLFFICLAANTTGVSQKLQAKYKIEKDIIIEADNGIEKKIATLEYEGHLYRLNNRYIFFNKPLYLAKHSLGYVTSTSGTNTSEHELMMDTIQGISYKDLDSLILRYRFDMSGKDKVKENYVQHFESGFRQWIFLPDTKEINGLKVQKAILTANGKPSWEVWFCNDIPMEAGPRNIIGLPGLMVEGTFFPFRERYSLLSYTTNNDFSPGVFWPNEFNQPFITRAPIKRKK
jgi:GLPGLI family protein